MNNGRYICLLRAAGTRMAGHVYAMHRNLRCKRALLMTVNSQPWEEHKKGAKEKKAEEDISSPETWRGWFHFLRATFPAVRVLRLADANTPAMDKIYYFVHKTSQAMEKSAPDLDDEALFPKPSKGTQQEEDDEDDYEDSEEESGDEAECGEEDSINTEATDTDDDEEDEDSDLLSKRIIACWNRRKKIVNSDFAILGWMLCVMPEVMADVKQRMTGEHRDAAERVINKLYAHKVEANMAEIIDTFWNEHKDFCNKAGVFNRQNRWNVMDVVIGNSHIWHEKYSLPYTKVLGYVACRVTSKILGIGSAERAWGDVKHLKKDKRAHLSGEKTEKQSILYTTARLEEARIKRAEREAEGTLFGDEDIKCELGLEKFGVDVEELTGAGTAPKRIFNAWIEDWEKPLLKKNDPVAEMKLLQKYKGLVFHDIDNDVVYTIFDSNLEWSTGCKGGWSVVGVPPEHDGDNDEVLEPWLINDNLVEMIAEYEQPKELNVKIVAEEDLVDDDGGDESEENDK